MVAKVEKSNVYIQSFNGSLENQFQLEVSGTGNWAQQRFAKPAICVP